MPAGISFKNSPENSRYVAYEQYLMEYGKKQVGFNEEIKTAKNAADTQAVRNKSKALLKELIAYRTNYIQKYPGTYLSNIFNAIKTPEVPEGTFYLEDKKTVDSNYAYRFYKRISGMTSTSAITA